MTPVGGDKLKAVYPLPLGIWFCTSLRSRAAYSASIPSASGAREKTICDSRHRANSLWCCFSAQSHGVSRFSFSANRSASLCTKNWERENKRKIWLWIMGQTHYTHTHWLIYVVWNILNYYHWLIMGNYFYIYCDHDYYLQFLSFRTHKWIAFVHLTIHFHF